VDSTQMALGGAFIVLVVLYLLRRRSRLSKDQ
jgi:hypothetical protein